MARMAQQQRELYGMCATAIVNRRADLEGASRVGFDIDLPIFSVGKTAELADTHPQTLRQYDRNGLIVPQRTEGGARRYSLRDIDRLVQAQNMSQQDGINLTGIARILDLEEENRQLRHQLQALSLQDTVSIFAADANGDITQMQRSTQARTWRHQFEHTTRELTSGGVQHEESHTSKSMVVWQVHKDNSV